MGKLTKPQRKYIRYALTYGVRVMSKRKHCRKESKSSSDGKRNEDDSRHTNDTEALQKQD